MYSFFESSFFPLPPDALLLAVGIGKPSRAWWLAFVSTVGSVLGGLLGYFIGYALFSSLGGPILDVFNLHAEFALVGEYFRANVFLTIAGAAFTPIPYKVFTIAAGFWTVDLFIFFITKSQWKHKTIYN